MYNIYIMSHPVETSAFIAHFYQFTYAPEVKDSVDKSLLSVKEYSSVLENK